MCRDTLTPITRTSANIWNDPANHIVKIHEVDFKLPHIDTTANPSTTSSGPQKSAYTNITPKKKNGISNHGPGVCLCAN